MDYQTLDWQIDGDGIATLTLNRPDMMNAFTVQMAEELVHVFSVASEDDAVRAIIVTGAGKAFCAGMDLSEEGNVFGLDESVQPSLQDMRDRLTDPEIQRGVRDTGGRVTLAMYECNKPIIGAINGAAVGIGATMTLAMDLRLASEKARIGFVFNKIGITPEACSSWFLPRIVGMGKALEWVYTADILDAQTALAGGLLNHVYEADRLLDEAKTLALRITRNRSSVAVALSRHMMWRNPAFEHPRQAHEVDSLAIYYASFRDGKEGVQSFQEKRDPAFKDRVSTDMPSFFPWWQRPDTF